MIKTLTKALTRARTVLLVYTACFFLMLLSTKLLAQDTTYTTGDCTARVGGGGNAAYNAMSAAINGLDGVPSCCPQYTSGSGASFGASAEYHYLFSKQLSIGARLGMGVVHGALTAEETKPTVNGRIEEDAVIEHRIKASLTDVVFSPFLEYRVTDKFPLMLGFTTRYNLNASYVQSETILSPSTLTFENQRRDRLSYEGSLPSRTQFRYDVTAGIGYVLPVSANGKWTLVPRADISLPLNNFVQSGTWKIASFGISIALLHNIHTEEMHITPAPPKPEPPPPPPPKPEPPKPEPKLIASISLREKEGSPKVATLSLLSKATQTAFPLLPYIFFDEASSQLAGRYNRLSQTEADSFSYRTLDNVPDLQRYCQVLNIVGKRMREMPKTSITLVGCNANIGTELNNKQLSAQRAKSVKDYLVNVWNIDEQRITLESRNWPTQFSNPQSVDGIEENRRVEIIPSSTDLYVPVFTNDTSYSASQPSFIAVPEVTAEAGVREWSVRFEQAGKVLWSQKGSGDVPRTLSIPINDTTAPRYNNQVQLVLDVSDNNGKQISAKDILSVPLVQDSSVLRKQFTLVLFDFNSSNLTPLNKRVAGMVKQQLKKDSRVTITGFADRSGNLEYNKKLALRRGETLAQTLNVNDATVSAYDGTLLINNDLPEGRYFCRTVRVILEDKR